MTEPLVLAYLAGLIDGEGCVSYQSAGANRNKRLTIQVNMTERAPVDLLAQTFGGSVTLRKREKEHHKDQYRWRVKDQKANEVLDKLRPFLLLKAEPLNSPYSFGDPS